MSTRLVGEEKVARGSLKGWLKKGLAGGLIGLLILIPNVLAVSEDITVEVLLQELHDDSVASDDYTQSTFTSSGYVDASVYPLNASAVMRVDGNFDGDLKDSDDYDLYNHIVIVDLPNGDIQFAYKLAEHSTYSNRDGDLDAGEVATIKGDKYVITDSDITDEVIELGPAIAKKLIATTVDKDNAVTISGTRKVLYGTDGGLWFYDAGSLVDGPVSLSGISSYPYKLTSDDIESDSFTPYNIYVVWNTTRQVVVTLVEKSRLVKIINDEDGIMGYASVKVGDVDWFVGGTSGVFFLSDPVSLIKGETIDLPDTYYALKYTSARQFDIRRKKTSTVSSGTRLKYRKEPGKDFLVSGASITVSAVSGDINIDFNSPELHDDYSVQDDYRQSELADAGYANASVNALNSSAVLRFDGNADGDLSDGYDYDLYNHLVVIDQANGDIQFAYKLAEHGTYSNGNGNIDAGEVITIKSDNYVITKNHTSSKTIELGPAIPKTLTATTVDRDNAVIISGTKKMLYGNDGGLWFYDEGVLADGPVDLSKISSFPYKLTLYDIESDAFTSYNIYVISATTTIAKVTFVEKSKLVTLNNDEEGVMGYNSVKIGDTGWFAGGTDGIFFLSDPISLLKGETLDLPDTYYALKYTTSKQFDILRKKISSVASGTMLKPTKYPGKDFLTESILLKISSPSFPSKPDLTISSYDISFSDSTPKQGDTVVIYAKARNPEKPTTDSFIITFYANGSLIGQTLAYEDQKVNVKWAPASGTYEIKVVVDEVNAVAESNENNNFATKDIGVRIGDIRIETGFQELHDNSTAQDDYTQSTFSSAGYADASVNALNASAVLRFDGNGDGDLSDGYDYDLYNHIVIVDLPNGDIQFAYKLAEHGTYSNRDGDLDAGEVVNIKGDKYVVTDNDTSDGDVELGPAIAKKLSKTTVDKDNAVRVSGTKKILYGSDGALWFYNEGSLVDGPVSLSKISSYPYKLTSDDIGSDAFTPYNIYVVSNTTRYTVVVTFVEKSQIMMLANDEEGVMGYASVKVGDVDWFVGGTSGVFFLSDPVSLIKGETIDLPDTYYQLEYTSSKQFDILRKMTYTVPSGVELKTYTEPGKNFLIQPVALSISGSDIRIEFDSQELHDNSTAQDEYTKSTFASAGYADASVNPLNASAVLRFDGNGDGDLKDPDDYDLYTHIVIIDQANGDIQFAYKLAEHGTYSNRDGDLGAGEVVTIKGDKYVITDSDTTGGDIELGPAIAKRLTATTVNESNAVTVSGTKKILYGNDGGLWLYDEGALADAPINLSAISSFPYKLTSSDIKSDAFRPYNIYVLSQSSSQAVVTLVELSQLVTLSNDEEGVMGYASVKVGDADWFDGGSDGVFFLSDPVSLIKGGTTYLPGTYYVLKYTASKQFDILRRKVSTVASGMKLKPTIDPGKDFLKENIIVTAIVSSPLGCGDILATDTVLTKDLSNCIGYGLKILASDIVLDCADHSITGATGTTGIYISGRNNTVKNCVLKSFDRGIEVHNSDNNKIINNLMTGSWGITGIHIESSSYNTILNNSVSSKSAYGIVQYTSNYNILSNNTVTDITDKGIYITGIPIPDVGGSSHSNISGNTVSNNGYGIYLDNEDNNLVTENYVYANTFYGIYLSNSWLNSVYHNNLVNNSNQAYDDGTRNTWDNGYPGGGNYWSDWTSPDNYFGEYPDGYGSDGIVDVAYSIGGGSNQDRYPVTIQNGWLYITSDIAPPTNPNVTFSLPSYMRKVGGSTTIPITMNTTTGIGSIQLDLIYDPSVINATNVAQGNAAYGASFAYTINDTAGTITLGIINVSGMSSNGSIADITFDVIAKGGNFTDLTPINRGVTDPENNELSVGLYNGNLTVYYRLLGDADADDMITAADALLYLRYAVGQDISPYYLSLHDDVICDGVITAADALQVLRKAVGHNIELKECS